MKGETAEVTVEITFTTENGELPDNDELERLVSDQMAGLLHEDTGLTCVTVKLISRTGELA